MKKIVHFGKHYYPDQGGIESVTLSYANAGVAGGDAVTVVCFAQNTPPGVENLDGVRVIRAPKGLVVASQPLGIGYLWHCLYEGWDADLVHIHVPNMLAALGGVLLRKGTKTLVHWHSDVVNKGWLGQLVRPLERILLRRASVIVPATQVYAEASETLAPFLKNVSVVPYGVPEPRRLTREEVDSTLSSDLAAAIDGRRVILAVGRLVPYKGFDVLIAAAPHLREDAVIVIVGGGPLQAALAAQIKALPEPHSVILAGRLPDRALAALFEVAELFCLSSVDRAEAFGVVLLEAMAYGLPIVASNIPGSGSPWINQHGTSGVNVRVGDAQALAEACNGILGSGTIRERYAAGARARFLAEFTEKRSIERMMRLYAQLTGKR